MTQERLERVATELHDARNVRGAPNTATMTFVVYVDDAAISRGVRERIRELAQKHPARVLFFDAKQRPDAASVDATLSHSEWIDLGADASDADNLRAAVERLALADVPLVVMWGSRTSVANELFGALRKRATSVICDSSLALEAGAALRALFNVSAPNAELAITDLAYLRIAPWQDCVASFFDDDAVGADTQRINRVEVTCGNGAEGHYVLGWLGSRLAWSPAGNGTFTSPAGSVQYAITRTDDLRRIRRIDIDCGDARYYAQIDDADANTIVFETSADVIQPRHCRALGITDMASLVERAILQPETDALFRDTLELAASIQLGGAKR